jgi:beta-fructofuranosidase
MPLDGQQKMLTLHIFLDHSVIEINVNSRAFLTSRIYPVLDDSTGLRLSARRGVLEVHDFDVWEMNTIWES